MGASETKAGEPFIGIREPKPFRNFPPGRIRLRMRNDAYARAFVRSEHGIRHFLIVDTGEHFEPRYEFEQGRNVVIRDCFAEKDTSASSSAEEWWAAHAALLAEKMKQGGVKDLRISLTDRGTYEFEVNPVSETNVQGHLPADGG